MELTRDLDVRRAYAKDASGLELVAEAVARPGTADEVLAVVREAIASRTSVTPAGGQTSMTGASVTDRGVLLSMADMSAVLDVDPAMRTARVQPGVRIGALNTQLASLGLRFAPDPTSEHDATVGGAIACNASGARSLRYGATRRHIRSLRVVNGSGDLVHLARPRLEKNTVGFHAVQDPVDWIVGSEGTLGVIVEAELALVELPLHEFGLALPFAQETDALKFVAAARERGDENRAHRPQCLEFFDGQALSIARGWLESPEWMAGAGSLVYLEQAVHESEGMDAALDRWLQFAESFTVDSGSIAVYDGASGLRDARRFRHAVPAHMNERGSSRLAFGGRKVSTDWAVPYKRLAHAIDTARRSADAHGVEQAVIYGHAGNGHPHQNFIANDGDALRRITAVIDETLHMVLQLGGTVAAEHGLGKLKRHWLHTQLSPAQLDVMRALKHALDPAGIFAPGNVL
ncbi:MAG TPA: FAD-binding oxidoreductase [Gemmatimonadaceae bacterium]